MVDFEAISKAVMEADDEAVLKLTQKALAGNIPAKDILDKGLVPGIKKVGELFSSGEYFLPELIAAGNAMTGVLEVLEPELAKVDVPIAGKFLIGTVKGDIHTIGKSIVSMMLKGAGWRVTDIGIDVPAENFCKAVAEGDYDILGLSALLTMTMPDALNTLEALKAAGLRDKTKVVVGGAPVTREWAEKAGFDGYADDASEAVKLAEALVGRG